MNIEFIKTTRLLRNSIDCYNRHPETIGWYNGNILMGMYENSIEIDKHRTIVSILRQLNEEE